MTNKKKSLDPEAILAALDHVGDTLGSMTDVVDELRDYFEKHLAEEDSPENKITQTIQPSADSLDLDNLDYNAMKHVIH